MRNQILSTDSVPIENISFLLFVAVLILFCNVSSALAAPEKSMHSQMTESTTRSGEDSSLERFLPSLKKEQCTIQENVEPSASAWREWRFKVLGEIYQRIRVACIKAHVSAFPALRASTSFRVTRDGHLNSTELVDQSSNAEFNSIVIESCNSLSGGEVLKFPDLSTRQFMDVTGTFGWQHTATRSCGRSLEQARKSERANRK